MLFCAFTTTTRRDITIVYMAMDQSVAGNREPKGANVANVALWPRIDWRVAFSIIDERQLFIFTQGVCYFAHPLSRHRQ